MSILEERLSNNTNMDIPLRQQFIAFLNSPLIAPHSLIRFPSRELVETIDEAYMECFGYKPSKTVTIGEYLAISINSLRDVKKHGSDSDVIDVRIKYSRAIMKDFYKSKERFPLLWNLLKTPVVTFGQEFNIPLPDIYDLSEHNQDTIGDLLFQGIKKTREPWWPDEMSLEEYGNTTLKGYSALCDLYSIFINAYISLSPSKEEETHECKGSI